MVAWIIHVVVKNHSSTPRDIEWRNTFHSRSRAHENQNRRNKALRKLTHDGGWEYNDKRHEHCWSYLPFQPLETR